MCGKCQLCIQKAVLSSFLASTGSTEFLTKIMNEIYLSTKHFPHFKVPTHSFIFKYSNYFLDSCKPGKIMAVFRVHFVVII